VFVHYSLKQNYGTINFIN